MAESHADLPPEGANFAPIIKLLTSKRDDDEWNGLLIAALRSVVANRQFPQQRCHAAGWTKHGKCIFCVHEAVTGSRIRAEMPSRRPKQLSGGLGSDSTSQNSTSPPATLAVVVLGLPPASSKRSLVGCPRSRAPL